MKNLVDFQQCIDEISDTEEEHGDILHDGTYLPSEFENGKKRIRSGQWSCCGSASARSKYCPDLKSRENQQNLFSAWKMEELSAEKHKTQMFEVKNDKEKYEISTSQPLSGLASFSVPMTISWIAKNIHEAYVVESGLTMILNVSSTTAGSNELVEHHIIGLFAKLRNEYLTHSNIQLKIAETLNRLTSDSSVISRMNGDQIREVCLFAGLILHRNMTNESVSLQCASTLGQCMLFSDSARSFGSLNGINMYISQLVNFFRNVPSIVTAGLVFFKNFCLASDCTSLCVERGKFLIESNDIARLSFKCLKRHRRVNSVLYSAFGLILFLLSDPNPSSDLSSTILIQLINLGAIKSIVSAMMALVGDEDVQLKGLRVIQLLISSDEGIRQLDCIPGGWQWLTTRQTSVSGNNLIHQIPGYFYSQGWCAAESFTEAKSGNIVEESNKTHWNSFTLKEYMGLSTKRVNLEKNLEQERIFYETVKALELLPHHEENPSDWFSRIRAYEREAGVSLNHVVAARIEAFSLL